MMGGIVGLFMIGFGIVWTIIAFSGAGVVFALFGVLWTGIAIVQTIYNFKNATGKNRYSQFDITDSQEESDPLNDRFACFDDKNKSCSDSGGYCPYCGTKAKDDYKFCHNCGKELPQ